MKKNFSEETVRLTDEEVVLRVRNGDYDDLKLLINRYMSFIINVANRYKALGNDTEDLIQDGVIALFSAVKSYENEKASFRTFATLCIERAIFAQIRFATSGKRVPESLITPIDEVELSCDESPENILIEKESYSILSDAIKKDLSPLEYRVFCEFLSGMSYSNIAETLNLSVKSVDNALKRIRSKLKK